jgi:hypothetical protein
VRKVKGRKRDMMEKTVGTINFPKKTNLNTPKLSNCRRISIARSEGKKGKKRKRKRKTHQISVSGQCGSQFLYTKMIKEFVYFIFGV